MQRTKGQNNRYHGLIAKLKLDADERRELISWASGGRCTSSKDLTAPEMRKLIEKLTGKYDSRIARMQAKVRAIADEIGLLPLVGGIVDYSPLNAFILKTFKVPSLFQLDYKKLIDCITALERYRDWKIKKAINELLS